MTPEAKAREQIDVMLIASGWLIQNYKALNLAAGPGIAIREVRLQSGPCDYLLRVNRIPVGVVEAKKHGTTLTEPMLKELEKKLRDQHAAWTEDNLWNAFAAAKPGKVKGRSQAGRFADLVALVRFALEQQPELEPFAESVSARFNEWLMDKAKAGVTFSADQLAWLNLIWDHVATSLSIEPDDFYFAPFSQRGGLGKAHQLFGEQLGNLLEELNPELVA